MDEKKNCMKEEEKGKKRRGTLMGDNICQSRRVEKKANVAAALTPRSQKERKDGKGGKERGHSTE